MIVRYCIGIIAVILLLATSSYAQWSSGYDNYMTPSIDEGAIGSGYDNYMTPGIDEGAIGSGYDNYMTPGIDEGSINYGTGNSPW